MAITAQTFYVPSNSTWIGNNARMRLEVVANGSRTSNTTMKYTFTFRIRGQYDDTWWGYYNNTIRVVVTNTANTSQSVTHYLTDSNSSGILHSTLGTDYHNAGSCTLNVTSTNTNNVSLKFTFERYAGGDTSGVTTGWTQNDGTGNLTQSLPVDAMLSYTTYDIDYILNDGTFSSGYNALRSANGGQEVVNPLSARVDMYPDVPGASGGKWFYIETPSRTGYTFNGWTISGMDSTTHHYWSGSDQTSTATSWSNTSTPGTSHEFYNLRGSSGTVTFTANWTPHTCTLTFNGNGGTGTVNNLNCTYGVYYSFPANGFTRPGYTFVGWTNYKINADAGIHRWVEGDLIKNYTSTNGNTYIIYAVWHKNPVVYIDSSSIWNGVSDIWVQQEGAWKKVLGAYVKVGDSWQTIFDQPSTPTS